MESIKLKNSVYAVVDTFSGKIIAASEDRDKAREELQFYKGGIPTSVAKKYKIAKLSTVEKFIR